MDTWKPVWRIDPAGGAAAEMKSLATVPVPGRAWRLPEAVAGHVVGWYPGAGVIFAEGHPAGGERLGAPSELVAAFDRLRLALEAAYVPLPPGVAGEDWLGERSAGFGGVGRLDATVNLRMGSSAEGAAVMAGVAALLGQAGLQELWRSRGRLETVYLRASRGGRALGRWYDKGAEAGWAPVGELLRAEDQRRWPQAQRRMVGELHGGYVRGLFHRRFVPLWKASKGVTVAGSMVVVSRLAEAVDAGDVTWREAERMCASILVEPLLASARAPVSRWTRQRARSLIARHGLVLADGVLEPVEVDLEDVLEACLEAGWERRG